LIFLKSLIEGGFDEECSRLSNNPVFNRFKRQIFLPMGNTNLKSVLTMIACWCLGVIGLFLCAPSTAFAGRPLLIDDATPVSENNIEIEFGLFQARSHQGDREQKFPVIGVTYGLYQNLEVGLAIQRVNDDSKGSPRVMGFEDLHLTSKYKFVDETSVIPALAFSLDIKIPSANQKKGLSTGKWEEGLLLIATKSISPVVLSLNVGCLIVNRPSENTKHRILGGLSLEWPFAQSWSAVGEVFGASQEAAHEHNEAAFQVGFRYFLTSQIVLDAAVGRSLTSTGNAIRGTVGLTWTVDMARILSNGASQ